MKLPSGAELVVTQTPFKVSKELYQAVLDEVKDAKVDSVSDVVGLFRGIFLRGMTSPRIETCLWNCFRHVTYNGLKIDQDTFEPMKAREDYPLVCLEVAHENVYPFLKNLSAQFEHMLNKISNTPK